jgi:hypothetical protein
MYDRLYVWTQCTEVDSFYTQISKRVSHLKLCFGPSSASLSRVYLYIGEYVSLNM